MNIHSFSNARFAYQSINKCLKRLNHAKIDCLSPNLKFFCGSDYESGALKNEFKFEVLKSKFIDPYELEPLDDHIMLVMDSIDIKFEKSEGEISAISTLFKEDFKFRRLLHICTRLMHAKSHATLYGGGFNMSGYCITDTSFKTTAFMQALTVVTPIIFPNMISVYKDCSGDDFDLAALIETLAVQKGLKASGTTNTDVALKNLYRQGHSLAFFGNNACSTSRKTWDDFYNIYTDTKPFIMLADSSEDLIEQEPFCRQGQKLSLNLSKIKYLGKENLWRS